MTILTALQMIRTFELRNGITLPGIEQLARRVEVVRLARRQNAFRQGEPAAHLWFVRSGLLKQQYVRADGSEWIKSFTGAGDLFACIHGIARREAAAFASVAIEPSVVERIDFRWLEATAQSSAAWQKAIRLGFQRLAELKVERERDLLMLKPRELYARLVASAPDWLPRVPQKDLAAHLGVTAVGLNRIVRASHRARDLDR